MTTRKRRKFRWPPAALQRKEGMRKSGPRPLRKFLLPSILGIVKDLWLAVKDDSLFYSYIAKYLSTILLVALISRNKKKRVGWWLVVSLYIDRPEHGYKTGLLEKKKKGRDKK